MVSLAWYDSYIEYDQLKCLLLFHHHPEEQESAQDSDEDDQQTSAFPSQTSILLQRIRNETFRQLELAWKAQQELARLAMIPEPDPQSQKIISSTVQRNNQVDSD